jgi:hypothetical protein
MKFCILFCLDILIYSNPDLVEVLFYYIILHSFCKEIKINNIITSLKEREISHLTMFEPDFAPKTP